MNAPRKVLLTLRVRNDSAQRNRHFVFTRSVKNTLRRNPLDIFPGPRVNLQHVADIDEQGREDFRPGFQLDGLGDVSGRIAAGAGLFQPHRKAARAQSPKAVDETSATPTRAGMRPTIGGWPRSAARRIPSQAAGPVSTR